jgi:ParB family chromosome partitioning protein
MSDNQKIKKFPRVALGRGLSSLISKPPVAIQHYQGQAALAVEPAEEHESPVFQPINAQDAAAVSPEGEFISQNLKNTVARENPKSDDDQPHHIAIERIIPNPDQPRKVFDDGELKELSESIRQSGVLQPVLVRPSRTHETDAGEKKYEIVAGERRWRASQLAGLTFIPAIIKDLSDWESLEIALVENVQRANLNPIEEAQAYQRLMDRYSLGQQDVADRIGKDRVTVANLLRILKLAPEVLKLVQIGKLGLGHAKVLLAVKDQTAQQSLAKKVIEDGLSVRATEQLISQAMVLDGQSSPALRGKELGISGTRSVSGQFPEILDRLRKALGTKVSLKHHHSGRGKIEVEYFSEAELERLIDQICEEQRAAL